MIYIVGFTFLICAVLELTADLPLPNKEDKENGQLH